MMNLQEFITETLKQIIDGVSDAQIHAKTKHAYINAPLNVQGPNLSYVDRHYLPNQQLIEFDIAVTTTDSKNVQGGMGIFVANLGIGYQGKKGSTDSEISRIKFSIPIVLPAQLSIDD